MLRFKLLNLQNGQTGPYFRHIPDPQREQRKEFFAQDLLVLFREGWGREEAISTEELEGLVEWFGGEVGLAEEVDELVCVPGSFRFCFGEDFGGEEGE